MLLWVHGGPGMPDYVLTERGATLETLRGGFSITQRHPLLEPSPRRGLRELQMGCGAGPSTRVHAWIGRLDSRPAVRA